MVMIRTGENILERRMRHRKEFLDGLGDIPEEEARTLVNFYFRPGGLYEIHLVVVVGMSRTGSLPKLLRAFGKNG